MNLERTLKKFEKFGFQSLKFIDANDQYLKSYPHIIKAVSTLIDNLGSSSIVSIAHIAYGWMPTVLKEFDFSYIEKGFILDARKTSSFNDAKLFISILENSPINNSWIGLSKVLHFINPQFFPIWDRKVAKHFGINSYQITKKIKLKVQFIMHFLVIKN